MNSSARAEECVPLAWQGADEELVSLAEGARRLLAAMGERRVCAFRGAMGVGKTTFIKAVCRELGVKEMVNSPSFAIINEYCVEATGERVYHLDFYRIGDEDEARRTGCEDCFDSGAYCFVEWPERAEALLPADTVHVRMAAQAGARSVAIEGER